MKTRKFQKFPFIRQVLLAAVLCGGALASANAELVLRYNFDEESGDALDLGAAPVSNGSFVGQAGRTNNTPSGTGYALDVIGENSANNNYVLAGNPEKLNNLTNGITLTWWMNLRAIPLVSDRIIEKLSSTAGFGLRFGTPNTAAGTTTFVLGVNTTGAGVASPAISNLNTWIFCAVTYDGSKPAQNAQFFLGSQAEPVSSPGLLSSARGQITNTANALRIGSTQATSADRTPPAWFDDVRVYNNILPASEIEQIRLDGGGTTPPTPIILSFQSNVQGYLAPGTDVNFSATFLGQPPMTAIWQRNGTPLMGGETTINTNVASLSYFLDNLVPDNAGVYNLMLSNAFGAITSAPIALNVTTIYSTEVLTNIWTLDPVYIYLTSNNAERGMAYAGVSDSYPSSGSLLVAHYVNLTDFGIAVLNAENGSFDGYILPVTDGGSVVMSTGTRAINMIGAADDGAIYVGNLTTSATNANGSYFLYRYASDSPNSPPAIAYTGDPGAPNYPGLRWGDSLAVRGSGAGTEVLIAPAGNLGTFLSWQTNIVTLLSTTDGTTFTPTVIWITNGPAFANNGLAFGPGTNTFFAKIINSPLRLVEFDANTGLGWVKHEYDLHAVPGCVGAVALSPDATKLGALSVETPDNFRYYSITDFMRDPELLDQEVFPLNNPNPTSGGVGAVAFGKNSTIYVLNSANGIKAFVPTTGYTPPASFSITGIVPNPQGMTISWPTEPGRTYQGLSTDSLTSDRWAPFALPVTGDGSVMSVTNLVLGDSPDGRFYRVRAQ